MEDHPRGHEREGSAEWERAQWSTPVGMGKSRVGRPSTAESIARLERSSSQESLTNMLLRKESEKRKREDENLDLRSLQMATGAPFKRSNITPRSPTGVNLVNVLNAIDAVDSGSNNDVDEQLTEEDKKKEATIPTLDENKKMMCIFREMLDGAMANVLAEIKKTRLEEENNIKNLRTDLENWKLAVDRDREECRVHRRGLEKSIADLENKFTQRTSDQSDAWKKHLKDASDQINRKWISELEIVKSESSKTVSDLITKINDLEKKSQEDNGLQRNLQTYMKKVDNIYVTNEKEQKEHKKLNIIIKGLEANSSELLSQVNTFLSTKFNVSPLDVTKAWSIKSPGGEMVLIGVNLKSWSVKLNILKRKKDALLGTNIYIEHDLTPLERKTAKLLRDKAKEERSKGRTVLVRTDKLRVDNQWMRWDTNTNSLVNEAFGTSPSTSQKTVPKNGQAITSISNRGT